MVAKRLIVLPVAFALPISTFVQHCQLENDQWWDKASHDGLRSVSWSPLI